MEHQHPAAASGALTMSAGLFLLYGNFVPGEQVEPFLATAAIAVLSGALLMLFMVLQTSTAKTQ